MSSPEVNLPWGFPLNAFALSASRAFVFVPPLFFVFRLHSSIFSSDEADADKKKKDKKKKKGEKEEKEKEKKKGPSKATVKAMQEALAKMKEVRHAGRSFLPAVIGAPLMLNNNCFLGGRATQEGGGGATEEAGGAGEAAAGAGTPQSS